MARDRPTIRTTCPYCGVGCGLSVEAIGRRLKVGGDGAHPANAGRLCSKGAALGQTTGLEERLLQASIHGRAAPYEAATAAVGAAFVEAIERHGPDSVAFYVSGQLLTEDYYAANKLMKGFIGSSNIDTNSRLCMASAVVAHKIAFGADLVPGCYEDLDLADLLVFSGHNAAATHPVLFRRAEAARARGQRHVVIDPRRTDTAEGADLHLALAPQTDVRLWNGLLADLLRRGAVDRRFIDRSVDGLDAVQAELGRHDYSRAAVAADCGLSLEDLGAFFDLFAQTDKTVSLFSMGANQSASGVDKGLAILNAHLLTGRIGRPGAAPFSITGQPNAMGGRETGGMATTLAAHMDFEPAEIDRVRRFWQAPAIAQRPGLRAVELFQALGEGRIKALWIMASNPAVTLPQSDQVRAALQACPFVAVSDCSAATDTLAYAHVKLPALAWGEKNGTVTNSERRISRQRPLFAAPGDARPDWRIIADVAAAMGHGAAFGWSSPAAVFGEWARLTTFENAGARALDLGALSTLTPEAYDALAPVQWPARSAAPSLDGEEREPWPPVGTARLFADGRFFRPGGRAALTPLTACGPASAVSPDFPLALNSGRVRDHWHTLTRTGLSADLCRHAPEPFVEIHPEDAERWGLRDGALARVQTAEGEAVMVAKVSAGQRRGALFAPMHWSDAYAPSGRVNRLTSSARDSRSGQPEFKHTPARIHLYAETWSGFALTREPLLAQPQDEVVWRRIPQRAAQLHQFAGRGGEDQRRRLHERVTEGAGAPAVRVEDHVGGVFREAYFQDGRLDRVVFFSVGRPAPPTGWLIELFDDAIISEEARLSLLLGRPLTGGGVRAPLICTCRNVRQDALLAAVAAGALELDAVCEATGAGAGCGSCRPEIAGLLRTTAFAETRHAA